MSTTLLLAVGCYLGGILLGQAFLGLHAFFIACFFVLIPLTIWGLIREKGRGWLRFVLAFCLVTLGGQAVQQEIRLARKVTAFLTQTSVPVLLEGRVAGFPRVRGTVVEVDLVPCCLQLPGQESWNRLPPARVRLRFSPEALPTQVLTPGDSLTVRVKLEPVKEGNNPGEPSWPLIMVGEGVYARGRVWSTSQVLSLRAVENWPEDLFWRGRQALTAHFWHGRGGEALGLAMLTGESGFLSDMALDDFRQTGLAHLLAVSGLHLGLVFGLVRALLERLGCPARAASLGGTTAAVVYALWAGWPISAARAALTMMCGALAGEKGRSSLGLVALTAFLLLVDGPLRLLEVGFQFSFLATLALVTFFPRVAGRWTGFFPSHGLGMVLRRLTEGIMVSVGVLLFILPVQVASFGLFSPWTPLLNLLAVPLAGLILPLAFLGSGIVVVFPKGGETMFRLTAWLGEGMLWLARWGRNLPGGGYHLPQPPLFLTAAYYFCLWGLLSALRPSPIPGVARSRRRLALAWGGALFLLCLFWALGPFWSPKLRVTFLSVGMGNAIHLALPGGHHVLVDAGPRQGSFDAGAGIVVPYLRRQGVNRLDLLVVTHPHQDHAGGVEAVCRDLSVGRVVEKAYPGDTWRWGEVRLEVAAAERQTQPEGNRGCLALRVVFRNFACLLLSDLERGDQERLLAAGQLEPVTVFQVAHHGSRRDFLPLLVEAIRPELAVITVGPNPFGHPDPGVLRWFAEKKIPLWRTDERGAVTVTSDGRFTEYTSVHPPALPRGEGRY